MAVVEQQQYNGMFAGVVTDVDDPEKKGRVRCLLPELCTDPSTGEVVESIWISPKGGYGDGIGVLNVPPVGASVWVQTCFAQDGGVYDLVYEPGRMGSVEGETQVPAVGQGEDDETCGGLKGGAEFGVPSPNRRLKVRGGRDAAHMTGDSAYERIVGIPPSANAGVYPHNKVIKTAGGFTVEIDDTIGAERFHIWHPEGAYLEINRKGVRVDRQTKRWEETTESSIKYIGGDEKKRVDGHVQIAANRNWVEESGGRRVISASELDVSARFHMLMEVGGQYNLSVNGLANERFYASRRTSIFGDSILSASGQIASTSLGPTNIIAGQAVTIMPGAMLLPGAPFRQVRIGPPERLAELAVPIPAAAPHPHSVVKTVALLELLAALAAVTPGVGEAWTPFITGAGVLTLGTSSLVAV